MALRRALASLVPKLAQPVPELVAPFAVQACKLPMCVMTEEQQQRPQAPMLPFSRSECSMHLGEVAAQPLSGGSTTALRQQPCAAQHAHLGANILGTFVLAQVLRLTRCRPSRPTSFRPLKSA